MRWFNVTSEGGVVLLARDAKVDTVVVSVFGVASDLRVVAEVAVVVDVVDSDEDDVRECKAGISGYVSVYLRVRVKWGTGGFTIAATFNAKI